MGLFGKSRKLCPICGSPAARFLATKVEGQPLCGECAAKGLQLPDDLRAASMATLESFREYLAVYDENQPLRDAFQESYQHYFSFLSGTISLDVPHRLLRLDTSERAFVLEPSNIRRFRILEDDAPLFEGAREALIRYPSAAPDWVKSLGPEIDRLRFERAQYEQMERIEERMERDAKQRGEIYTRRYIPAPDINRLRPFQKFRLLIELDHPYSEDQAEYTEEAPGFTDFYSSAIQDYLRDYEERTEDLHELAAQLMAILSPGSPERTANAPAEPCGPNPESHGKDGIR